MQNSNLSKNDIKKITLIVLACVIGVLLLWQIVALFSESVFYLMQYVRDEEGRRAIENNMISSVFMNTILSFGLTGLLTSIFAMVFLLSMLNNNDNAKVLRYVFLFFTIIAVVVAIFINAILLFYYGDDSWTVPRTDYFILNHFFSLLTSFILITISTIALAVIRAIFSDIDKPKKSDVVTTQEQQPNEIATDKSEKL
ncbi:MAG: hypothetical protein FWE13_02990 [Firmicutes bacterium]|nr:hypothetical protein [Bacillota bacterium]